MHYHNLMLREENPVVGLGDAMSRLMDEGMRDVLCHTNQIRATINN